MFCPDSSLAPRLQIMLRSAESSYDAWYLKGHLHRVDPLPPRLFELDQPDRRVGCARLNGADRRVRPDTSVY
jgi:hypothetical protein